MRSQHNHICTLLLSILFLFYFSISPCAECDAFPSSFYIMQPYLDHTWLKDHCLDLPPTWCPLFTQASDSLCHAHVNISYTQYQHAQFGRYIVSKIPKMSTTLNLLTSILAYPGSFTFVWGMLERECAIPCLIRVKHFNVPCLEFITGSWC